MSRDVPDVLQKILARKSEEIAERSAACSLAELEAQIAQGGAPRDFAGAMRSADPRTGPRRRCKIADLCPASARATGSDHVV